MQQAALALRPLGLRDQHRDPRSHAGERDPGDNVDDRPELSPERDELGPAAQREHLVDRRAAGEAGEDDGERRDELDVPLRETNETKLSARRNLSGVSVQYATALENQPILEKALRILMLSLMLGLGSSLATAEEYPSHPIHILVGLSAGSTSDILARTLRQKMSDAWGEPVIVDNRPSAGGISAASAVAAAAPDGYTLLLVSAGHAATAAMFAKLPYDTLRDFAGVGRICAPVSLFAVTHIPHVHVVTGPMRTERKRQVVERPELHAAEAHQNVAHTQARALCRAAGAHAVDLDARAGRLAEIRDDAEERSIAVSACRSAAAPVFELHVRGRRRQRRKGGHDAAGERRDGR